MPGILSGLVSRSSASPTSTVGVAGTALYGGYIVDNEKDASLSGESKYKTYSDILANTSIVSAGVRYFLNLLSKSAWTFEPSEADTTGEWAERAERILTEDPLTPWHRIVRRAAMYRFYGFSVQEWTARRHEEGYLTFHDIAPRAQVTIDRWDVDKYGHVNGVVQKSPQDFKDLYIPRSKIVYVVDDTLSDSPEGLGIFRHLVNTATRLRRYEQLEGYGFETDLRGIPVGRGPFSKLAAMVEAGDISQEERAAAEAPVRSFVKDHIKNPKLGLMLDSMPYETQDDAQRPSNIPQWNVELLKGSSTMAPEVAAAIERLNRELARMLGVEQLLLGSDSAGSFALSQDKTNSFFLIADSTLAELETAFEDDLLTRIWELNGWDPKMKPSVSTEAVRFKDVEQVTRALRDMAFSGATLAPDDPVINEVRGLLGLSPASETEAEDAMLGNKGNANNVGRRGVIESQNNEE